MENKISIVKNWLFWTVYPLLSKYPDGDFDDSKLTEKDIQELLNSLENEK